MAVGENDLHMDEPHELDAPPRFLGIECGATRTVVLLEAGRQVVRQETGPANLRLLNDAQLMRHLRNIRSLHAGFAQPTALAIGMAGARTEADRERIRRAASKVWRGVPCYATNDLETALMAAEPAAPCDTNDKHQYAIRNTQYD